MSLWNLPGHWEIHSQNTSPRPWQSCKEGGKEKHVYSEPSTGWFLWGWKVSQDELQQLWSMTYRTIKARKSDGWCCYKDEECVQHPATGSSPTCLFFCWTEIIQLTQGLASECKLQNLLCKKHYVVSRTSSLHPVCCIFLLMANTPTVHYLQCTLLTVPGLTQIQHKNAMVTHLRKQQPRSLVKNEAGILSVNAPIWCK